MKITVGTTIESSIEKVKQNFNKELFLALTPPWIKMELLRYDGNQVGDEIHLELQFPFKKFSWVSLIVDYQENPLEISFIDVGKVLPPFLKSWHHLHIIRRLNEKQTLLIDDVTFEAIRPELNPLLWPGIYTMLAYRKLIYPKYCIK